MNETSGVQTIPACECGRWTSGFCPLHAPGLAPPSQYGIVPATVMPVNASQAERIIALLEGIAEQLGRLDYRIARAVGDR